MGYLVDISDEEFEEPRPDRLTKAGIEQDLNVHLDMINVLLSRGVGKRSRSRSKAIREAEEVEAIREEIEAEAKRETIREEEAEDNNIL